VRGNGQGTLFGERLGIARAEVVFVSAATIWEMAIKQQLGRPRIEDADPKRAGE